MDKKTIFKTIVNAAKTIAPPLVVEKIYSKMFGQHFYSPKHLSFEQSDYKDWTYTKHTFLNYDKTRLVGYIYQAKRTQFKGIFVFAHGYGGGGHHCYLDLVHTLTKLGYIVFAYDATANDESEGNNLKGFTQGLLDADKAISYVESLKEYKDMPLYLMGHSWGAYSMSNALEFHPRVKGLIEFSGFNISYSIFEANGDIYAGDSSKEFLAYIINKEEATFGKLAFHSAIDTFENSKAKIAIIHSGDDKTVPISAGYNLYYPLFKDNKRFKFFRFNSRGHTCIYYTPEGKKYYDYIHDSYNKYLKDHKEASEEEKEKYLAKLIDRKKYTNLVDVDLIEEAIKFIK